MDEVLSRVRRVTGGVRDAAARHRTHLLRRTQLPVERRHVGHLARPAHAGARHRRRSTRATHQAAQRRRVDAHHVVDGTLEQHRSVTQTPRYGALRCKCNAESEDVELYFDLNRYKYVKRNVSAT